MANDYFNHPGSAKRFQKGTKVRAEAVNDVLDDVSVGLDKMPSESENNEGSRNYGLVAGIVNAYTISLPHVTSPIQAGQDVFIEIDTGLANTGPVTLNVSGIGNVACVYPDDAALTSGDLPVGSIAHFKYSSILSKWVLLSTSTSASAAAIAAAESASSASSNNGYAQEWANKAEDSLISVAAGGDGATDYSSLHWAKKSLINVSISPSRVMGLPSGASPGVAIEMASDDALDAMGITRTAADINNLATLNGAEFLTSKTLTAPTIIDAIDPTAVGVVFVKPKSAVDNVHLWFKDFAGKDMTVIYADQVARNLHINMYNAAGAFVGEFTFSQGGQISQFGAQGANANNLTRKDYVDNTVNFHINTIGQIQGALAGRAAGSIGGYIFATEIPVVDRNTGYRSAGSALYYTNGAGYSGGVVGIGSWRLVGKTYSSGGTHSGASLWLRYL